MKAVTHEDVDAERSAARPTHTTQSGVAHLAAPRRGRGARRRRGGCSAHLPQNNLDDAAATVATDDPRDRTDAGARRVVPDDPRSRTTCTTSSPRIVDDGDVPRDPAGLGREHHRRLRAARRPQRRDRRAAAGGAGRRARHRRVGQGGAVRPDLRLLQRPAGDLRRRAGLPAGRRRRSTAGSSGTARSCCTRTARRRSPSSRSSRARPTAAPTTS